jgi:uncharacterized spore protein YtfJ
MNGEQDIKSTIDNIFESLEKFVKSKTVVGDQIEIGDIKIIPLIDITYGLGSTYAKGKGDETKEGDLGSAGSGGKMSTSAIIVIKGDNVEVLPVKKSASFEKLVDMIPEAVDKIQKKEKDKEE